MADTPSENIFDVVIVGAGISGIIAAQRYLEAHPDSRLAILEKNDCIGGVFGRRRLYKEFWTQWTVGLAEYSDMPMNRPPEEDIRSECFKAKYTTEYLEKYVDQKSHLGVTLRQRIKFNINVRSIEKMNEKWNISCTASDRNAIAFLASKLMIASGENSRPNMPQLPGREGFGGVMIHSEEFGQSNVVSSQEIQDIAVLGAGKSSADMIYEAVKAGKTVSWIIQATGTGPGFFAPIDMKTPYKNPGEAAQTRIMASLQPSLFNKRNWWTWFLHRTMIGIWLVAKIFSLLDVDIKKRANYRERKSTKGFEKLEYNPGIFWQNNTGGAVHHPDFWDLVAEKVQVYRGDIQRLGNHRLILKDGTSFHCDAILCGTGWKSGIEFFSEDLLVKLDLPHRQEAEPHDMTAKWEKLMLEADEKVLKDFPLLASPPPHQHKRIGTTPYRLFNTMAPLNDDSILFMNHITAGNKFFAAEAQAIWAVAYFDNNVKLPSREQREKDVATSVAWTRRRYLSRGELGNFAAFDSATYTDKLLEEIGLTAHRKGWWRDLFEPFMPPDLGKAWREYLEKYANSQYPVT